MNQVTNFGKYLFALPMIVFGIMHFMGANQMTDMVPIPGGAIWVYLTGLALIAAGVSILIGKMDKMASMLLGIMLLIFALSMHLPAVMGGSESAMPALLKDIALAGGAWMYSSTQIKD